MRYWFARFCCLAGFAGLMYAQPQITGTGNAASVQCSPCRSDTYPTITPRPWLVPGGYYSIYGNFPGASVSNTTVYVTECVVGNPAAVFSQVPSYAGPTQINFQVNQNSYSSAGYCPSAAQVQVVVSGVQSNVANVNMVSTDAALYGCGPNAPYVQQPPSYSLVGNCGNPPVDQSAGPPILVLYGNAFNPAIGFSCGGSAPACASYNAPTVTVAGMPATLLYFGTGDPYWQLNVQVPSVLPPGPQTVTITNLSSYCCGIDADVISFSITFQ